MILILYGIMLYLDIWHQLTYCTYSISYKDYSNCCCWLACLQDPISYYFNKKKVNSLIQFAIGLNKNKTHKFTTESKAKRY